MHWNGRIRELDIKSSSVLIQKIRTKCVNQFQHKIFSTHNQSQKIKLKQIRNKTKIQTVKKKNIKIRERTLIFEASLNAAVQLVNLVLLIPNDEMLCRGIHRKTHPIGVLPIESHGTPIETQWKTIMVFGISPARSL